MNVLYLVNKSYGMEQNLGYQSQQSLNAVPSINAFQHKLYV